jgi:4-amino-4-deoxy-L-arabinose transferase-like glycosyltransferase
MIENRAGGRAFADRHFPLAFVAVLTLAAVNLTWRLGSEAVSQWDESLYGNTAWAIVKSGEWIATSLRGQVDYYNVKPPLNVWLLALAFKAFGANLVSLRLVSAISACGTVAVLQLWGRRLRNSVTGVLAGVVLATSFAFVYVHAGRSGNTDALFTLLILLTVVTLWTSQHRPAQFVLLGPLTAATFLLRGTGVLMPLSIVAAVESWRRLHGRRRQLSHVAAAITLCVVPVAAWMVARWRFDGWRYLTPVLFYNLSGTVTVLEGHEGGPRYYLDVLLKYHYDWLLAGAMAWILRPIPWRVVRDGLSSWRQATETQVILASWVAATVLIPTLMRTKNSWYLQPFYPAYALGVAFLLARSLEVEQRWRLRPAAAGVMIVCIFAVAEGRLMWFSLRHRDLALSPQGLLLEHASALSGHRIYRADWTDADVFVVQALVGADDGIAPDPDTFLRESPSGSYLMSSAPLVRPELDLAGSSASWWLYRRAREKEK